MKIDDIGKTTDQLVIIGPEDLIPLPFPYYDPRKDRAVKELTEDQKRRYDTSLDGVIAVGMTRPGTDEEERGFVEAFLSGLMKLFDRADNWTFLQPLIHSLDYCVKCQICNDSCPTYVASGRKEIYRPTFRPEVLRRIIGSHVKKRGSFLTTLTAGAIDLNWTTLARLAELAYRCTLCRRCAQVCPLGVDNALISREIRKLFSQELGVAPKELHESGTVQQLRVGSSTGVTTKALGNIIAFMEDELEERTGRKITIPLDKKGADILLLHNAGEFMAWPENIEAFAVIFDAAGINWTLSSEAMGYDAVNYGVWYDDIQFAKIAVRQARIARDLGVKKISLGECGHAHKAMVVVADRVLTGDLNIPRESVIPLLRDLVVHQRIRLDPRQNDFPLTLQDPCNIVRLMGIAEPQRAILREIAPQFREMEPHGGDNYCCGGGSGSAIIQSMNFPSWRSTVSGRMKLKQILDVFQDVIMPDRKKYVCAPCSNCKGQIRDLFDYYNVWEECRIFYGGLAELIANAMTDLKKPFIEWEWR